MRAEHRFVCTLPNGLHARPASLLAECAAGFESRITLTREVGRREGADLRSVLSVVGLDVQMGDPCLITAEGEDAQRAIDALRRLTEHTLGEVEQAAEDCAENQAHGVRLPVILRRLGIEHASGRPVGGGAGIGVVVHAGGLSIPPEARDAVADNPECELDAARDAIERVREELAQRARDTRDRTEAALLDAHRQITRDPALWGAIKTSISSGATAPQAVLAAAHEFSARLRSAASAYVRDRAIDVQDIAMQLLDELLPEHARTTTIALSEPSVVFAESLTANQLLRMDRSLLAGLVLGEVGVTSHTVILARNLGVPCVIGVDDVRAVARPGSSAVVDGDGGFVISPVSDAVRAYYEHERRAQSRRLGRLLPLASRPARTSDGRCLAVGVNATDAREIAGAVSMGADGVGLYRTEFLFLDREAAPDEDEQHEAYAAAVAAAEGRPIIFRTFDIGGDKPAPYLRLGEEENPFLGRRGMRLYQPDASLIDAQLRALLRAAGEAPSGTVSVMAPMVAVPAEAAWFRQRVTRIENDLSGEGVEHASGVPVGIMIEVPGAALCIDQLSGHADFFSIGTNDLCQYVMAADRGNQAVAHLCDPHHPAFLRLLRLIVREARAHGRWVGVCGEMGGRPIDLPLMIGLGVDEISSSARQVVKLKLTVADADARRCEELLDAACGADTPEAVEHLLAGHAWKADAARKTPLIDRDCIEVGNDASTKEYAIKSAVDLLAIADRTAQPRRVEEAVWVREETYSTGLGHGFAVPHCKCEAVDAPTLAVLRLAQPVEWGSMDERPVDTVLLLAAPDDGGAGGGGDPPGHRHMQIFAALARKLMHEEFRDTLRAQDDPAGIERFLREELGLS